MVQKHSGKISWDGLEAIELVGRYGSVRRAAEQIDVAHTTLAKRIQNTERVLGIVAFVRGAKGYVPTPAGEKIIAHAKRMSYEASAITRNLAGMDDEVSGKVTISLLPAILSEVLSDRLDQFMAKYPKIQLEFKTSYAFSNLDRNNADIAIRFQDQPADHLWGRRVLTSYDAVYASADMRDAYHGSDLNVPMIGWSSQERVLVRAAQHGIENIDVKYIVTDLALQANLAAKGQGVAILPCFVGDQHRGLVRFNGSKPLRINDAWVLTHPDFKTSERVQKVAQFCISALKQSSDLFAGKMF